MRSSDEVLDKIIKTNARLKEMLEADRKKKIWCSPAEGMTKAEIWECTTGEKLTDEEVQAKIDAIHKELGDYPTLSKHWEVLTGEKLTDEQVHAKIKASYQLPRNPPAQV